LAAEISASLEIPTIGIGAGNGCDGQVLVLHDMLGLNDTFSPRFLKRYDHQAERVIDAVARYASEVRSGDYPDDAHSFD
jgi:3-methyl-2-oxobutanoate hydroxymethyltransferase